MSPLVPYSQASNSFMARSHPGVALIALTISSRVIDLSRQTPASAGPAPSERMTAMPAKMDLAIIERPLCLSLVRVQPNGVQERPIARAMLPGFLLDVLPPARPQPAALCK